MKNKGIIGYNVDSMRISNNNGGRTEMENVRVAEMMGEDVTLIGRMVEATEDGEHFEALFKTGGGDYVLYGDAGVDTGIMADQSTVHVVRSGAEMMMTISSEEAKRWVARYLTTEEFEAEFGRITELTKLIKALEAQEIEKMFWVAIKGREGVESDNPEYSAEDFANDVVADMTKRCPGMDPAELYDLVMGINDAKLIGSADCSWPQFVRENLYQAEVEDKSAERVFYCYCLYSPVALNSLQWIEDGVVLHSEYLGKGEVNVVKAPFAKVWVAHHLSDDAYREIFGAEYSGLRKVLRHLTPAEREEAFALAQEAHELHMCKEEFAEGYYFDTMQIYKGFSSEAIYEFARRMWDLANPESTLLEDSDDED